MEALQSFDLHEGYASVDIGGPATMELLTTQILGASVACEQHDVYRLAIHAFAPSTPRLTSFDAFRLISQIEVRWNRRIRVGVIMDYEPTQVEEFGVLVALNRGIQVKLFTNSAQCLAWLFSDKS